MSIVFQRLSQYWWSPVDENGHDIPLTDGNQLNVFGDTPLHIAAQQLGPEDLRWLIEQGAGVNKKGEYGLTPLHHAYMGGKTENIDLLISFGADQTARCEA